MVFPSCHSFQFLYSFTHRGTESQCFPFTSAPSPYYRNSIPKKYSREDLVPFPLMSPHMQDRISTPGIEAQKIWVPWLPSPSLLDSIGMLFQEMIISTPSTSNGVGFLFRKETGHKNEKLHSSALQNWLHLEHGCKFYIWWCGLKIELLQLSNKEIRQLQCRQNLNRFSSKHIYKWP